jgi:CheY-like chemotaxis protein
MRDYTRKSLSSSEMLHFVEKPYILLCEDNKASAMVVKKMLQRMDFQVLVAANGADAVSTWKQKKPNVILMDLHMPVIDGHEATAIIRADPASTPKRPHIVAFTASVLTVKPLGMNSMVSKPCTMDDLKYATSHALLALRNSTSGDDEVAGNNDRDEADAATI